MIISLNWLKQFTQIDTGINELADLIGARLVEIEDITALGGKYKDVIIVRVVECAPVEGSDHLNVTKVDDGRVVADVERDENGFVQVVCGAPNVRAGMLAAWLPPGATVPDTYGTNEPFVLGARNLRGVTSNGMLASARELALFDDHEGIVEIDKEVAAGTPFVDAYAYDDYLFDIENKSLTHRPDTFGVIGFAREVAAIAGKGFRAPEWFENISPSYGDATESVELSAAIDNPELSSRYEVVALSGINQATKTPLDMQTYLARSGVRPISPIVDVTNYLMLLTGQPLHAFDYDKVVATTGSTHIHVREGHVDETLALLDGRTITLTPDDIVIAAGETAIALAGAMGGRDTEIDASTTRIIIESATFNLYNLRRTQMRHGIFSEAITRFTKGQPAALTAPVLAQAAGMVMVFTGATRASEVQDAYLSPLAQPTLQLSITQLNNVLGTRYVLDDAAETLRNVQFDVEVKDDSLFVTAPFWRTDIHIAEDLIEEVGRLNGYDTIEATLPRRDFTAVTPDADQLLRQSVRRTLSAAGANEVLTYSFVHGDLLKRAGQTSDDAYSLSNAISPDLQYYRLSLTPSLLDKVSSNLRQKYDEFALFEFGKVHAQSRRDDVEPELPSEAANLAFTYAASAKRTNGRGSAYYTAKTYVDQILRSLNVTDVRYQAITENSPTSDDGAPFERKRSAFVWSGEVFIGIVGEYKRSVAKSFKLPNFAAGFELSLTGLQAVAKATAPYVPLSRFPDSESDITVSIPSHVAYGMLTDIVNEAIAKETFAISIQPLDIYQPEDGDTRNITIRLRFVSYDRTLTRDDVNDATKRIADAIVGAAIGASII